MVTSEIRVAARASGEKAIAKATKVRAESMMKAAAVFLVKRGNGTKKKYSSESMLRVVLFFLELTKERASGKRTWNGSAKRRIE